MRPSLPLNNVFPIRKIVCLPLLLGVFWLLMAGSQSIRAQNKTLRKAIMYYEEGSYRKAIPLYQKALRRDFNFEAMRCLAESYRQVRDFEEAEKWYGYVVNTEYAGADDFLHYGLVLMRLQRYEEATDQFARFAELNPRDERGPRYLEAARQSRNSVLQPLNYEIRSLPVNSPQSDFCAIPYRDGLLFSSGRIRDKIVRRSSDRDGNPFLDLYYVEREDSQAWGKPHLLKGRFNTRFHEAAAVYDSTENLFFFTRNNFLGGKLRADREGMVRLKIYFAGLEEGGDWTNLQSLPFNSDEYSVGHPSVSGDGQALFFASDMPGGYGGTDLWMSTLSDTGWSAPVNLGPLVNTVGDELFPAMQQDGNLYFASSGHGGSGGLDIFMARPTPQGWSDIRRLPAPVNSPFDDFGYVLNPDGTTGFFSSDREGGQGSDDVYAFRILNPTISGKVLATETETGLEGALVRITETGSGEEQLTMSRADGRFDAVLQPDRDYMVAISRDGYMEQSFRLNTRDVLRGQRQEKTLYLSQPKLVMDGLARDKKTGYALAGVQIELQPGNKSAWSAMGGSFHLDLEPGQKYTLVATRPGYRTNRLTIDAQVKEGVHRIPLELEMAPDVGKLTLQGQVLDPGGSPLEGVELFLVNRNQLDETTGTSGTDGSYSFPLNPGENYELVARHPGYMSEQESFQAPGRRRGVFPKNLNMRLVGAGQATTLKTIYYDYGEAFLRDESLPELDKLVKLLKMNPDKRMVISSCTDSRGSDAYNLKLSQHRAEAVTRYLRSKGIEADRLEAIGYGETRLVNDCSNGRSCTEAQHQANRRTEFVLLPAKRTEARIGPAPGPMPRPVPADGNYPMVDVGEPVCYRVQVGIFDSPIRADIPIKLGELGAQLRVEPADTALYRYQLGECEIYAEVKKMYFSAKGSGFAEAFIAAYQDGRRVAIPKGMERPEEE